MSFNFKPLDPFSTIGMVSLASEVSEKQARSGLETLRRSGFNFKIAPHAFERSDLPFLPPKTRLADLNSFLNDKNIRGIWALRGGYGSIQLLAEISYELFRQASKILIGFSDLTALQWALWAKIGMPSLSGLAVTSQVTSANPYLDAAIKILRGKKNFIEPADLAPETPRVVQRGQAEGILLGGTLSVICSLSGTPYFPGDNGKVIFFMEDVNEPLYRIDRFLQQLRLNGFWQNISGLIVGKFMMNGKPTDVMPLLKRYIPGDIPVISGFPYGHLTECFLLPNGVKASLKADPFFLQWENIFDTSRGK